MYNNRDLNDPDQAVNLLYLIKCPPILFKNTLGLFRIGHIILEIPISSLLVVHFPIHYIICICFEAHYLRPPLKISLQV